MKFYCSESELTAPVEYLKNLILDKGYRIVLLTGEMGAGKTTFTRYMCKSLGSTSIVNSPTYSFLNEYKLAGKSIFHFDLFRISDEKELLDIGLPEIIDMQCVTIIEWWEVSKNFIPKDSVEVKIQIISEEKRSIEIQGRNS